MNARRLAWPPTPRDSGAVRRIRFRTWPEAWGFAIDVPSLTRPRIEVGCPFTVAYVPRTAGDIWP